MEEERMGFFSQLIGSITKIETYRRFFKRTTGKAILYLFILSLIFGTAGALRAMYYYNRGISELINFFQYEAPSFTLENGELNVEGSMPIVVDENDGNVFIIDTTGGTDESILDKYPNGILITKDELIQKENYSTKRQSFKMAQGVRITKEGLIGFFPLLRGINILIVVFGFIFHFIGKLISALLVAIAGSIISSIVNYNLTFGTQYKLSVYALTLPIIIKAVLSVLGVEIPYFWIPYYGIAIFYMWKAINMLKENGEIEELKYTRE
jgi:hypothetical protein